MQQDVEKPQLLMVENIDVAAHYASSPSLQDGHTAKNKRQVRSHTDDSKQKKYFLANSWRVKGLRL